MYIAFDCETTGLHEDSDLLTVWFGIYNSNFKLLDELELYTKPDTGFYKVQAQALEVNKINLVEHDKLAIYYKEVKPLLYKFLVKNIIGENKLFFSDEVLENKRLIPIGQNVQYDINKICNTLISKGSWENFISRRALDTMYIAKYLQTIGKIPQDISISLGNLIEYFEINVDGNQHESKYDAIATVEVLRKMLKL